MKKTVHLICNSHLDPVWLWEWQEGAAEALALARTVVELCEEHDGFVFNRNEVMFYEWIEEYAPDLFKRIRRLVRAGRWHVMGGWYVQPDCNMPGGETFVRQILTGRRYFRDRFGVDVTTAVNFDPFGHTRGLVQILARSGYDAYLCCRPDQADCGLPGTEFVWVGYDGSEILGALAAAHYNSPPGGARRKIEQWMNKHPEKPVRIVPWGVGNHGGGPSWRDIVEIAALMRETRDPGIIHSTPERFFEELREIKASLPRHERDLNPWAVGCYTSMMRVKRRHRRLENGLYVAEKMAAAAWSQGLMPYPQRELKEANRDLLAAGFHDALPGTSIPPVEEGLLNSLGHGLEILSRVKTRAFFALTAGQPRAKEGEFPILVFNPHPHAVSMLVECELQPPCSHGTASFEMPRVFLRGRSLAAQPEKEHCNIGADHRKRVVFAAVLEPGRMNRFDCRLELVPQKPGPTLKVKNGAIRFKTDDLDVVVSAGTGLLDRYRIRGIDYVEPNACCPLVMQDNADSWGMTVTRFRTPGGRFRLMSRADGTRFSGVTERKIPSVRVIEDGPVRSVVEAVFAWGDSFICQRYKLPRQGTEIGVETRVHWNEKDRMLKLSIPTPMAEAEYLGQVAYGVAALPANGDEAVAQKWVAVVSRRLDRALTCINDAVYGSDMARGELRLSLLRSPAYSGHPTGEGRPIVRQDRYVPRMDQGEHVFRFTLNGGPVRQRLAAIDREALVKNEEPLALTFFPSGEGETPRAGVVLSDKSVVLTAFKNAEDGDDLIIRLFEPTGRKRSTTVSLPFVPIKTKVRLGAFEIKTLRFSMKRRRFAEVNLLEEPLRP